MRAFNALELIYLWYPISILDTTNLTPGGYETIPALFSVTCSSLPTPALLLLEL